MSSFVNIGLVQMAMEDDAVANRAKAVEMITDAASLGAQIVCLPELFTTPYFCNVAKTSVDYTETIPGPTSELLSKLARALKITIVGGSIYERTSEATPRFFNTALTYGSDGSLLSTYRKMHIPHDEAFFEKHYFAEGDLGYQTCQTGNATIGTLICFDQWFPEAARATTLLGAQIIFYPSAIGTVSDIEQSEGSWQEAWENVMRGHAIANSAVMAAANRVGTEGRSIFWGGSFVCDAFGKTLIRAGNQEQILVQQVDLDHGKYVSDSWRFLPNRRPDSYSSLLTKGK